MKTLVIFYSRTGTTKKVAQELQKALKADIEEISSENNYSGPIGYMKAGKEATLKKLPKIKPIKSDLSKYDLVIIGTPIWAFTMASPIRTFLKNNNLKNVAFFCTMDGSGNERAFKQMEELSAKPKAILTLLTKQVWQNNYKKEIIKFVKEVK